MNKASPPKDPISKAYLYFFVTCWPFFEVWLWLRDEIMTDSSGGLNPFFEAFAILVLGYFIIVGVNLYRHGLKSFFDLLFLCLGLVVTFFWVTLLILADSA